MTRPGGPAEPPGPSAGDGIVQEWGERMHGQPSWDDWRDLARRIDDALAERETMVMALREALTGPGGLLEFLQAQASSEDKSYWRLRRWAEKRGLFIDDLSEHRAFVEMAYEAAKGLEAALTSTADAAARYRARAKAEGAEEMRRQVVKALRVHAERLKHTSHRDGLGMGWQAGELLCEELATAMGALDAGDPAARRG